MTTDALEEKEKFFWELHTALCTCMDNGWTKEFLDYLHVDDREMFFDLVFDYIAESDYDPA